MSDMRKVSTKKADDGRCIVCVQYGTAFGSGNTIEDAANAALSEIDEMMLRVFQERLMILAFLDQQKKTSEVSA